MGISDQEINFSPIFLRFSLIVLFLTPHFQAFACTCEPTSSAEAAIEQADLIFSGVVISNTTNWMSGGMKYTFKVDQIWKRRADQIMVINSGWKVDCGYMFQEGKRYLVYANKKFTWKTNSCSGNKLLSDATPDLSLLGEGSPPSKSELISTMYWAIGIPSLLAGLFLAFVVLRKKKPKQ